MNRFRDRYFILDDTLSFFPASEGIYLIGHIACRGELLIAVNKLLEILASDDMNDPVVEGKSYEYNASVYGHGNIFRYDNTHDGGAPHPSHAHAKHKHFFDWTTGLEKRRSPVQVDVWPTLGSVIQELSDWHAEHYDELPNPEGHVSGATLQVLLTRLTSGLK